MLIQFWKHSNRILGTRTGARFMVLGHLTVIIIQMAECENSLKWMPLKHSFDLYSKLLPLSSFAPNCLFAERSCSLWRKAGTTELCQTSQVRAKAFVDFALSSCDSVKVNRLVVLGPTQWFGQWTLCSTIITNYGVPTSRCLLVVISLKVLFHLQYWFCDIVPYAIYWLRATLWYHSSKNKR